MSRIGKKPVAIPSGVNVSVSSGVIDVKGPKGQLQRSVPPLVNIAVENGNVVVTRNNDEIKSKAMHGLTRALIQNMVTGVSQGFQKVLEIQGVGYRAVVEGKALRLELGYSHPVIYPFPHGIDIKVEKNQVTVIGIDKEAVGQTAAEIRAYRPPEPYKGKGVRYLGEVVKIKVGKKNA